MARKEGDSYWSTASEEADARDHEVLVRLGKTPVMKRNFGFATILGFMSTITLLWESTLLLMDISLQNGGPEGFIYGFILVWAGCVALFACLSELASMAPTAGGQYHWVAMMSAPGCQRFASYIEGWLAVVGWQGSSVSAALLSSRICLGLAKLCNPGYEPEDWHATVLAVALIGFAMLINITGGVVLPRFEGMVLVLHLVGFFAVLVPLLTLGQQLEADDVFEVFVNGGHLPNEGLTYWVGLTGIMYAFVGGDGAIHLSEEIQNAPVVVPRAIMFNYIVNGALAFGISIAALFSRGTLQSILDPPSGFAVIEIITHSVRSLPGAAIMVSIIAVLQISSGVSNYAAATRMLWGFARDHGVPGWRKLQTVDESTTVPFYACLITALISSSLACINIGSPTAFNDVVSVAIAGLYGSYLLACGMLLYHRCKGTIAKHAKYETDTINTVGVRLQWGPFHLPGVVGIAINTFAVIYLTGAFFFVFWPTALPVRVDTMNYASAMFGGVVLFSALYYLAWGHRDYFGPVVETNAGVSRHQQHPSHRRAPPASDLASFHLPTGASNATDSRPPTAELYRSGSKLSNRPGTADLHRTGSQRSASRAGPLDFEKGSLRRMQSASSQRGWPAPLEAIGTPRGVGSLHTASSRPPTATSIHTATSTLRDIDEELLESYLAGVPRATVSDAAPRRPAAAVHPWHPSASNSSRSPPASPRASYEPLRSQNSRDPAAPLGPGLPNLLEPMPPPDSVEPSPPVAPVPDPWLDASPTAFDPISPLTDADYAIPAARDSTVSSIRPRGRDSAATFTSVFPPPAAHVVEPPRRRPSVERSRRGGVTNGRGRVSGEESRKGTAGRAGSREQRGERRVVGRDGSIDERVLGQDGGIDGRVLAGEASKDRTADGSGAAA